MSNTIIVDASHLRVGDTIEEIFWGGAHFRVDRAQRKVWGIKHHAPDRPAMLGDTVFSTYEEAEKVVCEMLPYSKGYWSYSIEEVDG